ncbi:MAG TPA: DUF4232 domain-containing protein [Gaiellaceae bacterium]|nr:DUF4232 domain-containing protein [Gaiellaceae bacterium]
MVGTRRLILLALPALVLFVAGCGLTRTKTLVVTQTTTVTTTAATTTPTTMCSAGDLTGVFKAVPGSAGAGQISYELVVTNTASHDCIVTGLPTIQLLDASGNNLPTHEDAAHPGQATAALITLHDGDSASAQARFSPDVNGVGDSTNGACQPQAATVRVVIGSGTLDAPVQPPTSVCEQGSLHVDVFTASS